MANDEDLARLRQGVDVWNDWRARKPNRPVNLSGAQLEGARLEGANLRLGELGIDRFGEARWKQLEDQLTVTRSTDTAEGYGSPPPQPAAGASYRPAPPRRQVAPSSWMTE